MKLLLTAMLSAGFCAAACAAYLPDTAAGYAPPVSGFYRQENSQTRSADSALAGLRKALKEAQKNELEEMGYYFSLKKYSAGTKPAAIYADVMNISPEEAPGEDFFTQTSGKRAVEGFSSGLEADAADEMDNIISRAMSNLAAEARKAYTAENFEKLQLARHSRQEDGDMDYLILMGEESDGSILALIYIRNPY